MGQWEPGTTVKLLDGAKKIAMSINIKHLLSIEPGAWSESIRGEFNTISDGFVSVTFPLATLLPFTTYGKALKARKNVALALEEVIRKRMDEKAMVGFVEGEKENNRGKKDMVDLLAAGYDTTSLTMTLAAKFLTEKPTALAQLRVRIRKNLV
ncbi:hypothetical protein HU200_035026 [Digitaria exilis]|uniref:Cytochrome P450 n=1 Tax=Digitaria exilis TaxID=1010633 RepID=A0A835BGZ2_9POAL|nr:hypothetical protein HU200_035026 [Digitaria exilis]